MPTKTALWREKQNHPIFVRSKSAAAQTPKLLPSIIIIVNYGPSKKKAFGVAAYAPTAVEFISSSI